LGKTIALVDRYSGGHHRIYAEFFRSALLELGFDVVPVLPPPSSGVDAGAVRRGANARAFKRWVPRIVRQTVRTVMLRRRLALWERKAGRSIDAIFFACIYDWDFDHAGFTSRFLRYPWTGLYLQASSVHSPGAPMKGGGRVPDVAQLFSAPQCLGLGLLDELAIPKVRASLPSEKKIVWFPDVTSQGLPEPKSPAAGIADDLVRRAAGRPIVSLLGALQRSKGIELFTELVADPRMADVCFFLGGEISWEGIPATAKARIEATWRANTNLIRYPYYIPDEPNESAYNAIVKASTVLFAAYPGFPHSSNTLTKAACLRVPVVCTKGSLMGNAVDQYELGGTFADGDFEAAVRVIRHLISPEWRAMYLRTNEAAAYAERNSAAVLKAALAELLG
jgi:glycosyltransferase involved in cell wall biosynthesis